MYSLPHSAPPDLTTSPSLFFNLRPLASLFSFYFIAFASILLRTGLSASDCTTTCSFPSRLAFLHSGNLTFITCILLSDMGGNGEYIAGYGHISLAQAVYLAQNSENGVDQRLARYLEDKLAIVWRKVQNQPDVYVFASDEFALFNYYRSRFEGSEIAKNATKRYWDNHRGSG
jgi:hypothetical protein